MIATKEETTKPQLFCPRKGIYNIRAINPVSSDTWIKPKGGLWTSTFTPNKKYCSAWIEWCATEAPEWIECSVCYIIYPSHKATLYIIDSLQDLIDIHDKYGDIHLTNKYNIPVLHWEDISDDYDGLNLTEKGETETRWSERPYMLNGWDSESTVWFRNVFSKVLLLKKERTHTCSVKS